MTLLSNEEDVLFIIMSYIKQFLKLSVDSELVYMIEICYSKQSCLFFVFNVTCYKENGTNVT